MIMIEEGKQIKQGYPTVFGGDVVITNPATKEKGDEIDAKASKLPKKEQSTFLATVLVDMWSEVEVLAVADDCIRFAPGDKAMGTPNTMKGATVTPDGNYLIINEKLFKGKW